MKIYLAEDKPSRIKGYIKDLLPYFDSGLLTLITTTKAKESIALDEQYMVIKDDSNFPDNGDIYLIHHSYLPDRYSSFYERGNFISSLDSHLPPSSRILWFSGGYSSGTRQALDSIHRVAMCHEVILYDNLESFLSMEKPNIGYILGYLEKTGYPNRWSQRDSIMVDVLNIGSMNHLPDEWFDKLDLLMDTVNHPRMPREEVRFIATKKEFLARLKALL
jgi:hypothetical protein